MKLLAVAVIVAVAVTVESTAIFVAAAGGVAGVVSLVYALVRTSTLHHSIERQARELRRVRQRVDALDPLP